MPRIPQGFLTPMEVWEFADLTRASLASLQSAGIIGPGTTLSREDAVVARAMRWLFWSSPSVNRPGGDDRVRTAAAAAATHLRKVLGELEQLKTVSEVAALANAPAFACVVIATGRLYTAADTGGSLDGMRHIKDPWVCLPVAAWKREADERWPARISQTPRLRAVGAV